MTLSAVEVDDGVDPVRRDPQCDGEIDVAAAVGIDEGVDPVRGERAPVTLTCSEP